VPSKSAKKTEEKSADLLSFLGGEVEARREAKVEVAGGSGELERAVISFLRSKGGKAAKSELYEWAKRRGVPPAALYNALTKMLQSGAIRRSFDESLQEIVFALTS
jgi:DNA-binding MarR family transcriptional regulator